MILFPNAKINIGLNVVSRRPDGYHELSTLFYPVGWHDILEVVPTSGSETTLTVSGNHVDCPTEKNLVMKAYRAMSALRPLPPVDIFLHKIIPDGAGLGGGSSDASATLIALNELFSLGYTPEQLADVAATLGADCPFFIFNRPLMAAGIGDEFSASSVELKGWNILIAKPPVAVSTAEAYKGVRPHHPSQSLDLLLGRLPVDKWQGVVVNDFEESVFPTHQEIARLKESMLEYGAVYCSMSGSGASVYGLFRQADSDRMSALRDSLPADYARWSGTL